MSRVDELKKSRNNLSVKFLEFTRLTSKGICVVFFEGEDEKYYGIRINNICCDLLWSGLNVGGKKNVLKLRENIRGHKTYKKSFCIFFVDADFDENINLHLFYDTYVTPCYSVENLYVSLGAYKRILNSEFGISSEYGACYNKAISIYEKTKMSYFNSIREFNYLIYILRNKEKKDDELLTHRLNINNVNFNDLIKIDLGCASKVYDEKKPSSIFPEVLSEVDIKGTDCRVYFEDLSEELWFRGKQHLEFLRVFINKLKIDRCSKASRIIFKDKGNVKLLLSKANCISELSQYADTPKCLHDFLSRQKYGNHYGG